MPRPDASPALPRELLEPEKRQEHRREHAVGSSCMQEPMELYGVAPCITVTHVSGTMSAAANQNDGDDIERYAMMTASTTDNNPRTLNRIIADSARPRGDMKCRNGTSNQP